MKGNTVAKNKYYDSPFGLADHPHLNKADTKFNQDNPLFKVGLDVEGAEAEALAAKIDAASQAAFDAFFEDEGPNGGAKLTPAERKKFTVYKPYERLEDDNGEPTGVIRFDFKQNEKLRLNDGTTKKITIGLYDAAGNEMDKLVRHGSEVRIRYSMRPIPMKSLKQVGVRLDFAMVQVRKLAEGGAKGFGAVDGYVDDGEPGGGFGDVSSGSANSAADGDY